MMKKISFCEQEISDFLFFGSLSINHYYKTLKVYIGETLIPNIFNIGFHKNRFSYKHLDDEKIVDKKFDDYNIPYESIWFDIDHVNNKK